MSQNSDKTKEAALDLLMAVLAVKVKSKTNNFASLKCDDINGLHVHRCSSCKTTWQHPSNHDDNSHDCPTCGEEEYQKLYLDEIPKVIDFPWKGEK